MNLLADAETVAYTAVADKRIRTIVWGK
jgi:hypothetical protein